MSGQLIRVDIDKASLAATTPEAEHERRVAIYDLLQDNDFQVDDAPNPNGPFGLELAIEDGRLAFNVTQEDGVLVRKHLLSLTPFKRLMKDYFDICQSYYEAIRQATPMQIETIDMARRSVHNEGSELLKERLAGKITVDFDTARRLFTLICALHRRNQP